MRITASILTALALVATLAACGAQPAASAPPKPSTTVPVPVPPAPESAKAEQGSDPEKLPESALPIEPPDEMPSSTPSTAVGSNALEGTTWTLGEYTLAFKKEPEVLITGGQAANVSPDGIAGEYHLKPNASIEVNAMGEIHTGTFDGKTLNIDGKVGIKLEQPAEGAEPPAPSPSSEGNGATSPAASESAPAPARQ
jgi:hypothetical protein